MRLEERSLEAIERIGTADQQLPAPMEPIQHGLLLIGIELGGIEIVPEDYSNGSPSQRVGRERHPLFDDRAEKLVVLDLGIGRVVEVVGSGRKGVGLLQNVEGRGSRGK